MRGARRPPAPAPARPCSGSPRTRSLRAVPYVREVRRRRRKRDTTTRTVRPEGVADRRVRAARHAEARPRAEAADHARVQAQRRERRVRARADACAGKRTLWGGRRVEERRRRAAGPHDRLGRVRQREAHGPGPALSLRRVLCRGFGEGHGLGRPRFVEEPSQPCNGALSNRASRAAKSAWRSGPSRAARRACAASPAARPHESRAFWASRAARPIGWGRLEPVRLPRALLPREAVHRAPEPRAVPRAAGPRGTPWTRAAGASRASSIFSCGPPPAASSPSSSAASRAATAAAWTAPRRGASPRALRVRPRRPVEAFRNRTNLRRWKASVACAASRRRNSLFKTSATGRLRCGPPRRDGGSAAGPRGTPTTDFEGPCGAAFTFRCASLFRTGVDLEAHGSWRRRRRPSSRRRRPPRGALAGLGALYYFSASASGARN